MIAANIRRKATVRFPNILEFDDSQPFDGEGKKAKVEMSFLCPFENPDDGEFELSHKALYPIENAKSIAQAFTGADFKHWLEQFGDLPFSIPYPHAAYAKMIADKPLSTIAPNNLLSFLNGDKRVQKVFVSDYLEIPDLLDWGKPNVRIYRTAEKPLYGEVELIYGFEDLSYYNPMRPPEHNQLLAKELIDELGGYLLSDARVITRPFRESLQYPIVSVSAQSHDIGLERIFVFSFHIGDLK